MYIDDELKEYLDLKFNELVRHIEMKCGYINKYKKDVTVPVDALCTSVA